MQGLRYLKDVVNLELDVDKCVGCGLCETVCPHGIFAVREKKAVIVDKDACMECGACAGNCPVEAIKAGSGVGCAAGIIAGALRGTGATCDSCCDSDKSCCD